MTPPAARLRLAAEGWEAVLDPALGASLLALRHRGRNVLRPAPEAAVSPLEASCFPLVPYANRIAAGRFIWEGDAHALPPTDPVADNSLHGVGWRRAWHVVEATEESARLTYFHAGDADWPWRFAAEQAVALTRDAVEITLVARNEEPEAKPMALGFHPYFAIGFATELQAEVAGTLLVDAQMLPVRIAPPDHFADWLGGEAISLAAPIDHTLTGWQGRAVLRDGEERRVLTATGASALHLYSPEGAAFACLEPVSHLPDAINRGGMPIVEAGKTARMTMRIALER